MKYQNRKDINKKWRKLLLSLRMLFYIFVFVVFRFKPELVLNDNIPCLYKKFFGVSCLGCGTTNSVYHIFRLELLEAVKHNILGFLVVLVFLVFILSDIYSAVFKTKSVAEKFCEFFLPVDFII